MASLTLTIPDAKVDFIARAYGWTPESGVTRGAWIKARIIDYTRERTRSYDLRTAVEAALVTDPEMT